MTFYNYKIINRSTLPLNDTYFGQWVDPDLGYYLDDYVGCDVSLGLGFCYNGDAEDEGASGYGFNPPAVGVDFFQGLSIILFKLTSELVFLQIVGEYHNPEIIGTAGIEVQVEDREE